MKIRWLGHSCFEITTRKGTVIVTDPFDAKVGYPVPAVHADLVLCSHGHFDHCYADELKGVRADWREVGSMALDDVRVTTYPSFHDDAQGTKRGENRMALIEADGKRVLHLGDLGHMLDEQTIASLQPVDVLMIPVGGVYTIDGIQAAGLARAIGAKTTVAMHFSTPQLAFPLSDEQPFLKGLGQTPVRINAFEVDEHAPALIVPTL